MSKTAAATPDTVRLAMAQTNDVFNTEVFGKRNFEALERIYTAEARILPPGNEMVSGREAIKGFWSGLIQAVNAKAALLTTVEAIPSGEGILEIGRAALSIEPDGQPAQLEVKYVVYWLQEGGTWKWHVDIWNTNE